jgi:hypothetical protein
MGDRLGSSVEAQRYCDLELKRSWAGSSIRSKDQQPRRNQDKKKKKDPPLQKTQGWGTLRVFLFFGFVDVGDLSMEELARPMRNAGFLRSTVTRVRRHASYLIGTYTTPVA